MSARKEQHQIFIRMLLKQPCFSKQKSTVAPHTNLCEASWRNIPSTPGSGRNWCAKCAGQGSNATRTPCSVLGALCCSAGAGGLTGPGPTCSLLLIFIPLPCMAHNRLLQPESKRDRQGDRKASTLVRAAGEVLKQGVCRAYQLQRERERLYLRHCRTLSLPPLPHSRAPRPTGPSPSEPCWTHLWRCNRELTAQQNCWQGLHCLFQSMLLLIPCSNK